MGNDDQIKKDILEVGRRMYGRGYVASNDGNITVRVGENEVWATPTGVSKGFMTEEMLVKVDLEGNVLEGTWKVTSELPMHLRVFKERPDVKAVVHAHPPFATTYAAAGMPLDKYILTEAIVSMGTVPVAEYGTPSTQEVPDGVAKVIQDHDCILLANHGALTCGQDLFSAYNKMENLEFYATVSLYTGLLGKVNELPDHELDKLMNLRKKMNIPGRHPGIRNRRRG